MKLKEIKAVNNKIFQLKPGFVKKSMKKLKSNTSKLKNALKNEKKLVKKVLKELLRKQKKILKIIAVYDKKFSKKNNGKLNKIMTVMNTSLQSYIKYPYFKAAYQNFITYFVKKVKSFNKNHFKDLDSTARKFIKKHWMKFFNKEKKKWKKQQTKKEAKKRNKKNKKHRKSE